MQVRTVNPVLPTAYIEKPPFPVRIKEYSSVTVVVNKSDHKTSESEDQIKIQPQVAMIKDLVAENIDGSAICFCEDASNIVHSDKSARIVGTPVVSVKIGDHCYYGLCNMGASSSAIPFSLYQEVMHEITPCEIEDIDVTIKLANR